MRTTAAFNLPRYVRSVLLALALFATTFASSASVFVSVNFAPPPLPVYEQPLCPGPDYIWVPGYWAYGPDGYYWVPGTWVLAPFVGALWTPGYWGFTGAVYLWHPGYWGWHVGYYGGIDYGFGYFGVGYVGGYWRDRTFYYNTSVNRVDATRVHSTYNRFVQNVNVSRASFNGPGGTTARPTAQDRIAQREAHRPSTPMQAQHERLASRDRGLLASANHGSPTLAATPRAGTFGRSELRGRTAGANEPRTAQVAPGVEARPPRPETRAQERTHPQGASRMEPRREARAPGMERTQVAPHRQAMPAPEMHAQTMPRPQAAPRMQPAPRPEMHAQGQSHEGRGGQGRREERRGG